VFASSPSKSRFGFSLSWYTARRSYSTAS